MLNCCFVFYTSCLIFSPYLRDPIPWFIEPLKKRAMGLNDQSLLAELLCRPHYLVGIIQSLVWLSCFTRHFSPGSGLMIRFSRPKGWLTVVSSSTSPFLYGPIPFFGSLFTLITVLLRYAQLGKSIASWVISNLSQTVSIKFDIYRVHFPFESWHKFSNSDHDEVATYLVVELFELSFLSLPYQEDLLHVAQSDEI